MAKAKGTKRKSGPAGLPRAGLARALRVSTRQVDRLIAAGLRPVGTRGASKLYRVVDARRLARRLAPVPAAVDVQLATLNQRTEEAHEKAALLRRDWIADSGWRAVWGEYIAAVERHTSGWPEEMMASVPPNETDERRRGHAAQDGLRPLLTGLVNALADDPAHAHLCARLAMPVAISPPPPARTVVDGKRRLLEIRGVLIRRRIDIRRGGWHRRQEVQQAVVYRLHRTKWMIWQQWPALAAQTGDRAALVAAAWRMGQEMLAALRAPFQWQRGGHL